MLIAPPEHANYDLGGEYCPIAPLFLPVASEIND